MVSADGGENQDAWRFPEFFEGMTPEDHVTLWHAAFFVVASMIGEIETGNHLSMSPQDWDELMERVNSIIASRYDENARKTPEQEMNLLRLHRTVTVLAGAICLALDRYRETGRSGLPPQFPPTS